MNQEKLDEMWNVMKERHFEIDNESELEFKCLICKKIMINASVAPCGCQFCLDCIGEYLKDRKRKCPGQTQLCDIDEIDIDTDIHINRLMNIQISKLSVNCPNIDCQSRLELVMISDHLRICRYQTTARAHFCIQCGEKLANHGFGDHLTNEFCPHPKSIINDMSDYRNEIDSMKRDVDIMTEINKNLKTEIEKSKNKFYIEILIVSIVLIILSLGLCFTHEKILENQSQQISIFQSILENQNEEIHKFETKIENQTAEIETVKQRCQPLEDNSDKFRHQSEESPMKAAEIPQAEILIKSACKKINKEGTKEIIDSKFVVQYVWKIDNWTSKVSSAEKGVDREIFSDSFLTHPHSYKICLAMIPYQAFFFYGFCILGGPYDKVLRWPFDRNVAFIFVNSKTGGSPTISNIKCSDFSERMELTKPNDEKKNKAFYYNLVQPISPEMVQNNRLIIIFTSNALEIRENTVHIYNIIFNVVLIVVALFAAANNAGHH